MTDRSSPDSDQALVILVDRFAKRLLAKLQLAHANGRRGWEKDDWESECQLGLLRHLEKGDPRDVAAYCAFMDHHGWITVPATPSDNAQTAPEPIAWRYRNEYDEIVSDWIDGPPPEYVRDTNTDERIAVSTMNIDVAYSLPPRALSAASDRRLPRELADREPNHGQYATSHSSTQAAPAQPTLDRRWLAETIDPDAIFDDIEGVVWSRFTLQQRELAYEKADRILAAILISSIPSTERACTCHPDERLIKCQHKYSFSECLISYLKSGDK